MIDIIKKFVTFGTLLSAVIAVLLIVMVRDFYDNPAIRFSVFTYAAGAGALFARVHGAKASDSRFQFRSSNAKLLGLIGLVSSVSTMVIVPEYERYWYKNVDLTLIVISGISLGFGSIWGYLHLNSKKFRENRSRDTHSLSLNDKRER
jgi:hypothetical protein